MPRPSRIILSAGVAGVTFDGPDIVDQTGIEDVLFSFDENGEGTVASRFTGAASYDWTPGVTPPPGITINATTGNPEGTATSVGVYPDVTIRGTGADFDDTNAFVFTITTAELNKLKVGANDVDDLKFGSIEVDAAYLGTTQVWP